MVTRRMPLTKIMPDFPARPRPPHPSMQLLMNFRVHLTCLEDCFTQHANTLNHQWTVRASKDEKAMGSDSASHLVRLVQASAAAEVRVGWHYYSSTVREVLAAGCTHLEQEYGSMRSAMYTPIPYTAWGFRATAIQRIIWK